MSGLVGPDGKTPIQSDAPKLDYRAGGLMFSTPMLPDHLLQKAVNAAQQAVAGSVYNDVFQKTNSAMAAQAEAQSAAASIGDPFTIEPAAMAVFMYLSREIEYRDRIIRDISERLEALGAEPLNLEHPYPLAPKPEDADEESEESDSDTEVDADDGDAEEPKESSLILTN